MTAPIGMNLGEARRRQQRAKDRQDRFKVDPSVREARLRILDRMDAAAEARQAAVEAERRDKPDAIRAVLFQASIENLGEFARTVGQMDGRRMAEIAADVLRQRQRAKTTGGAGMPVEAAQSPARTNGRAKATHAE